MLDIVKSHVAKWWQAAAYMLTSKHLDKPSAYKPLR